MFVAEISNLRIPCGLKHLLLYIHEQSFETTVKLSLL